ncbi:NGFI-A-binding protein 2 [Eucyclogobius newberryi]|uniref:NGFI-A-binding protein 2 n=1 Tax=Eucyclogobius newberryi TaxID=166745 RepID=UPI003B5CE44A
MTLPRTLGELQLYRVLQRANLLSYYDTFIQQGGDDVQQLCEAAEEEFLEIMALVGMATKPLHVRRLQKALRDWAANPAVFSQPVSSVPLLPMFKVDGTGTRAGKGLSNGQPGSPCEREDRACLTPMRSGSPRSPCSQPSPQPPDTHYRDKLSPMDPHWLCPDQDAGSYPSGPDEDAPSPPLPSACPPGPSASPGSSSALSAWSGGQLDPDTTKAVMESVDRLLRTIARSDPAEVKTLLRMNKKMAKIVGHIFKMGAEDVNKEEEIRKYSLIYGRFDSKRREGKQLTHHELIINEAAAQFCIRDNALLLRRVELFSLARQVARKCAYTSTLKHARTNTEENHMLPLKRPRHEILVPENLSLLGVEGPENLSQRNDDDSSAESLDSVSHDVGSQCNKSPSPRPHNDSSNPASWNRHLMQQTLMDEGLRLARMVSHDRAAKISPGPEGNHATEHDTHRQTLAMCRSRSPSVTKDESHHRAK